jgi:hypothetical protein
VIWRPGKLASVLDLPFFLKFGVRRELGAVWYVAVSDKFRAKRSLNNEIEIIY